MGIIRQFSHPADIRSGLLWRESIGHALRQERLGRGERLSDVATRADLSPQYLSEIERGLKDPSSEILRAVADALELEVPDLARRAADIMDPPLTGSPTLLAA